MLSQIPRNLYPRSTPFSKIPKSIKNIVNEVLENPIKIDNGNGVNDIVKQISAYNNNKHICEYKNNSVSDLKTYFSNYSKYKEEYDKISFDDRKHIFLKAADLLQHKYYDKMLAYTILSQNKTLYEAELDSICELVDFLRFNVHYADLITKKQPIQTKGITNLSEYNSLNGFVASITPFNFTAIGGNLATAPLLFGNSVLWKPSDNSVLPNYLFYEIMLEAGLPKDILNFSPMEPYTFLECITREKDLASVLFTGSSQVMDNIYFSIGKNIKTYKNYPRIVGETGGKNFHFVETLPNVSNDLLKNTFDKKLELVVTKTLESAFNFSGQKCSACSVLYLPEDLLDDFVKCVNSNFTRYMTSNNNYGVINEKAYNKLDDIISNLKNDREIEFILTGDNNKEESYFIHPQIFVCRNHEHKVYGEEFFGPLLTVYPYNRKDSYEVLDMCIERNNYALTGSIFSNSYTFTTNSNKKLRQKTGNFYINDKSTGSVVGQQPFGGSGKSGTNDKAGDINLLYRLFNQRNLKINNLCS